MSNFAFENWKLKIEKWKDMHIGEYESYSIGFMRIWACAEDCIKVSAEDLLTFVQHAERLERLSDHPNELGYVDGVTGLA